MKLACAAVALFVGTAAMAQVTGDPASYDRQQLVTTPIAGTAFESVCHLRINRAWRLLGVRLPFGRPKYTGTGVLYRGRYIVTAGHNVYEDNSDIKSIDVRCGEAKVVLKDRSQIDAIVEGWAGEDAEGYSGSPFGRDFGVMRLDNPIAVERPFALAQEPVRPGTTVTFAGYPAERNATNAFPMTRKAGGWTLHAAKAKTLERSPEQGVSALGDLIYYDLVTYRSNSGGPVWRTRDDGTPELVAVHVTDFGGRIVNSDFRKEVDRLIDLLDDRARKKGVE